MARSRLNQLIVGIILLQSSSTFLLRNFLSSTSSFGIAACGTIYSASVKSIVSLRIEKCSMRSQEAFCNVPQPVQTTNCVSCGARSLSHKQSNGTSRLAALHKSVLYRAPVILCRLVVVGNSVLLELERCLATKSLRHEDAQRNPLCVFVRLSDLVP